MRNEEWGMKNEEWGMGNGEWGMGNEEWEMENGEWGMGNGEWGMGNEEWGMRNGKWGMRNEEWEMRNGELGMGNEEWGMRNGEWGIENEEQKMRKTESNSREHGFVSTVSKVSDLKLMKSKVETPRSSSTLHFKIMTPYKFSRTLSSLRKYQFLAVLTLNINVPRERKYFFHKCGFASILLLFTLIVSWW